MNLTRIHVLLFIATIITTFTAGYAQGGDYISGLSFSLALIFILGAHEMGHYFYGRKYGVLITPPYFIPAPPFISPIGTFGAFIKIKSQISSKKALFDIGVAGPIWGIIATIPVLIIGLKLSNIINVEEYSKSTGIFLGSSPIFSFFVKYIIGEIHEGYDVLLHPVAFAGWIGLLVTALNLIPFGQLDGGHLIYSVFSKRVHLVISNLAIITLMFLGFGTKPLIYLIETLSIDMGSYKNLIEFEGWSGWLLWAFLLIVMGTKHPPTVYEEASIGWERKLIVFITLLIFIGCFMPIPINIK